MVSCLGWLHLLHPEFCLVGGLLSYSGWLLLVCYGVAVILLRSFWSLSGCVCGVLAIGLLSNYVSCCWEGGGLLASGRKFRRR